MRHLEFKNSRGWDVRFNTTAVDIDKTRAPQFHGDGTATYFLKVEAIGDENGHVCIETAPDN